MAVLLVTTLTNYSLAHIGVNVRSPDALVFRVRVGTHVAILALAVTIPLYYYPARLLLPTLRQLVKDQEDASVVLFVSLFILTYSFGLLALRMMSKNEHVRAYLVRVQDLHPDGEIAGHRNKWVEITLSSNDILGYLRHIGDDYLELDPILSRKAYGEAEFHVPHPQLVHVARSAIVKVRSWGTLEGVSRVHPIRYCVAEGKPKVTATSKIRNRPSSVECTIWDAERGDVLVEFTAEKDELEWTLELHLTLKQASNGGIDEKAIVARFDIVFGSDNEAEIEHETAAFRQMSLEEKGFERFRKRWEKAQRNNDGPAAGGPDDSFQMLAFRRPSGRIHVEVLLRNIHSSGEHDGR